MQITRTAAETLHAGEGSPVRCHGTIGDEHMQCCEQISRTIIPILLISLYEIVTRIPHMCQLLTRAVRSSILS